ncbi:hypothetical protein CERSUDRAFT_84648 [Gelatoporia subvermispora B]|uniref:Uncharacterized protein n=1 Tax=Ceriporiopsis subvermispora (strain B) TaxID=914234 RepID=M2PJT6_CERS8|nr:hypothetical protein CERSUDRAFT_84648 [Gelatoporia subvermispora B]
MKQPPYDLATMLRILREYTTLRESPSQERLPSIEADICCAMIGSRALRLQSGRPITVLSVAQLGWSLRVLTTVKNHWTG